MIARYATLAAFLALVVIAAAIGASFEAGDWYFHILNKPDWTPPPWLFGPVWSVLYVMMALAAWKVWLTGHYSRIAALSWWVLQLVMNAAWSWLFFGLQRPGWAWLEMRILIFKLTQAHRLTRIAAAEQELWLSLKGPAISSMYACYKKRRRECFHVRT